MLIRQPHAQTNKRREHDEGSISSAQALDGGWVSRSLGTGEQEGANNVTTSIADEVETVDRHALGVSGKVGCNDGPVQDNGSANNTEEPTARRQGEAMPDVDGVDSDDSSQRWNTHHNGADDCGVLEG